MRSISPTATPYTSATWQAVIPYFAQARMHANCDLGISTVNCRVELAGSSCPSGLTGAIDGSVRGLRTDWSAGSRDSETNWSVICRFGVKSASAVWRGLAVRAQSSLRDWCSCGHLLDKSFSVNSVVGTVLTLKIWNNWKKITVPYMRERL